MAGLSGGGDVDVLQCDMEPRAYNTVILTSFLVWAFIHHVASPLIFNRNVAYRALNKYKRMEWDSRVVSTLHATSVSILCVVALMKESQLWEDPFFAQGRIGLTALCISIGYFLCDLISMPIYYDRKNQLIFTVHHSVATISFYLILIYRMGLFFGVYRLTTELSTPFTNQRWFYRKVGYTPDRRRVAIVSLIFSIFFAITRNFMIVPYWLFVYSICGTPKHMAAREQLPGMDLPWFVCSLTLDALNIYWALTVYPIGYKSAYMLYKADWRTDFHRARDRIRGRFLSARRRAMNTELITSLRRSTSFNLIQRAWEEWSLFPEDFSETELFTMSVSERSSPLRRYSDSDDSNSNRESSSINAEYLDLLSGGSKAFLNLQINGGISCTTVPLIIILDCVFGSHSPYTILFIANKRKLAQCIEEGKNRGRLVCNWVQADIKTFGLSSTEDLQCMQISAFETAVSIC
ncbi:transmembrane protein 56 B [Echinococcus multilocularis]|uniref:Transmembrane protein 56 B n=1 Tax=Echinococcus multilocularis TaxID=6211 RepID=A0A068YFI2_ECHMU|nr:transmembrane protein 56 B [Echinococcus multilocularis]